MASLPPPSSAANAESSKFSVHDVKNIVRGVVASTITGFAFAELWSNDDKKSGFENGYIDEGLPSSLALTLLLIASISAAVFALIMLFERSPLDAEDAPEWKKHAGNSQVYLSVLLLLSSAFYAGLKTESSQSIGAALGEAPGGMFLGAALLKVVEYILCVVLLLNKADPLYKSVGPYSASKTSFSERLDRKRLATKEAWLSLGFAFAIVTVAALTIDCSPGSTMVNGTAVYDGKCVEKPLEGFLQIAFITLIVCLGLLLLVQGFILGFFGTDDSQQLRAHVAFDGLGALVAYTSLSAVAMEVGRGFYEQFYAQLFLSANFYYFAGLLFGFFGVVQLEGEDGTSEKRKLKLIQKSQGVLVIMAVFLGVFTTSALWSADVLYNKLESDATHKLALGVYALVAVLVLASHTILVKTVEALAMPELRICGIFSQAESKKPVSVTTKRSEATLALALASAVFFGHPDYEVSILLVFLGAAAARVVGFWHRFRPEGSTVGNIAAFIYDSNTEQLKLGDEGVLFGALALLVSAIFVTVYVFRTGDPFKDAGTLEIFEFIAWLLILVHVLLTGLGMFTNKHAGAFPIVRFGASSLIIVILSSSLGEHPLKDGLYPYIVPALLLYVMYDGLSQARF